MPSTWSRGGGIAGDGSNPGALPPPTSLRVRLSDESGGQESHRFCGFFPNHLLTDAAGKRPKVALRRPILSEAVDLPDLERTKNINKHKHIDPHPEQIGSTVIWLKSELR